MADVNLKLASGEYYDQLAAFCVPAGVAPAGYGNEALPAFEDTRILKYGRAALIDDLRALGTDVVIVRGVGNFSVEEGVAHEVHRPGSRADRVTSMQKLGTRPLGSFDVVRNLARRLDLNDITPVLNHPSLYDLALDKHAMAIRLAKLGLHQSSALVDGDIEEALASIPGNLIALKPNSGNKGEGVYVGDKVGALNWYISNSPDKEYIVEEKLDTNVPLPSVIVAIDDKSRRLLEEANRYDLPKEFRAHWFGGDDYYYVVRAAKKDNINPGADEWVFIDQDHIPTEFVEVAKQVTDLAVAITGIGDMNVAVDMTYTTTAVDKQPKVRVMEFNSREPTLVNSEESSYVASLQRKLMAKQISRVAAEGLGLRPVTEVDS